MLLLISGGATQSRAPTKEPTHLSTQNKRNVQKDATHINHNSLRICIVNGKYFLLLGIK
jgi:hypothetical protein